MLLQCEGNWKDPTSSSEEECDFFSSFCLLSITNKTNYNFLFKYPKTMFNVRILDANDNNKRFILKYCRVINLRDDYFSWLFFFLRLFCSTIFSLIESRMQSLWKINCRCSGACNRGISISIDLGDQQENLNGGCRSLALMHFFKMLNNIYWIHVR